MSIDINSNISTYLENLMATAEAEARLTGDYERYFHPETRRAAMIRGLKEMYDRGRWFQPIAVTLTMKQRLRSPSLLLPNMRLSTDDAAKNLHLFLDKLNGLVLGKQFKRRKMRLNVIPIQEESLYFRIHYHLVVDCPLNINVSTFTAAIYLSWYSTLWAYRQIDTQAVYDFDGWLRYLKKRKEPWETVDFGNLHLAGREAPPLLAREMLEGKRGLEGFEGTDFVALERARAWLSRAERETAATAS
jgi:hypothetical protein